MTGQFVPPSDEEIAIDQDNIYCNEEERKNRLSICQTCEKFKVSIEKGSECSECGCSISMLILHSFKTCPLEKW